MTALTDKNGFDMVRQWRVPLRAALSSLQFKASMLVVTLVLVVAVTGLGTAMRFATDVVHEQSLTQTRQWADSLASSTSAAVATADAEALVRVVNETIRGGGARYVAFSDAQSRVLASGEQGSGLLHHALSDQGRRLKVEALGSPRLMRDSSGEVTYIDVVVPVLAAAPLPDMPHASPKVLGYLRLASDFTQAQAWLQDMSVRLQRLGLLTLLLVALCSLVAMRKVVSPLNELSRTAKELASGVMDARAEVDLHNEIGDLARAFNEMAERLAGAQFEMLKLNAELEERVQQRTHQLEDLASREPLTGLYNRRYFSEVITREFAAAERYDADLTVLMFDLDHFKETNDKFGHRAGDEMLVLLADCIRAELREADVAARFGGDEFILLLPRASAAAAANVADRITGRFMDTLRREWPEFPTTLSIGVASLRVTHARSAEALIHEADLALYSAKTAGRNRTMSAAGTRT